MSELGLTVEQGGEYAGEIYVQCFHSSDGGDVVLFEGGSLEELLAFLREHGDHG